MRKPKADYRYFIYEGNIIAIEDLSAGNMSVTNDMEQVLFEIQNLLQKDLSNFKIIYKDSDDNWDGIKINNFSTFSFSFISIQEQDLNKAIEKIKSYKS